VGLRVTKEILVHKVIREIKERDLELLVHRATKVIKELRDQLGLKEIKAIKDLRELLDLKAIRAIKATRVLIVQALLPGQI
jgi:hypothetical protein